MTEAEITTVEFCGCTNDALEQGRTCGRPECPNHPNAKETESND